MRYVQSYQSVKTASGEDAGDQPAGKLACSRPSSALIIKTTASVASVGHILTTGKKAHLQNLVIDRMCVH